MSRLLANRVARDFVAGNKIFVSDASITACPHLSLQDCSRQPADRSPRPSIVTRNPKRRIFAFALIVSIDCFWWFGSLGSTLSNGERLPLEVSFEVHGIDSCPK
jgi:hypothetical protein